MFALQYDTISMQIYIFFAVHTAVVGCLAVASFHYYYLDFSKNKKKKFAHMCVLVCCAVLCVSRGWRAGEPHKSRANHEAI